MFIRKGLRYVFMDQASGDVGGGAGGGDPAASAADPAASAGTSAAAATDQASSGTALESGAAAATTTPAIPEKYQVKKEDGSIDIEASSLKLAEAYSHLEKRLGAGDAPPKTAEEYEIAVPDSLKDTWNPKEDPLLGDFLKKAHAAGFTQKQIDLAMSQYMDIAPKLVAGSQQLSAEECTAELQSEWKTPEQYKTEVGNAYKAAKGYAGNDADYIIKTYGNDPKVVRMLARMGGEMGEDGSVNPDGGDNESTDNTVQALMASEAYNNAKHPDHARVSKQVSDHFSKKAAAAEKAGNVPIL